MALCNSERRDLSWYKLVIILVFGIATYHYGGTTMASEIANRVSSCPRNESELEEASRRLNCTNPNEKNTKNRYHCLPVHGLTTLLEFCYNQTRPLVVNGTCMVYVQSKYILNGYNCATFDEGCPDDKYFSDETYLFPYCTNIDPVRKCYVAEPACRITTILSTEIPSTGTILWNVTSASSTTTADKQTENENGGLPISKWIPVVIVTITIGVLGLILYIIYKRRKTCLPRRDSDQTQEEMSLLDENIEAEIENLKINFILDKLPKDSSKFRLIANKLKIPIEILFWTKENRKRFVDSMTVGKISVYSGRGMVVGCAKAGKTTLVKKLKGEKNLHTESTRGIEIHSHVFKLHTNESTNESTIIACKEQEKSKGSLCIAPNTLYQQKDVYPGVLPSVSESIEEPALPHDNIELQETQTILKTSTSSKLIVKNETLRIQDGNGEGNTLEEGPSQSSATTFSEEDNFEGKSDEKIDFNSCEASVNKENLMMLSLLDFAGQSAYYACHHIFFSPRAFYILVVDMSKNLDDLATQACTETDLIYSNWTHADYIRYWLGSIHTHSSKTAPVILVASHSERIGEDPKREEILSYYHKICRCLPQKLLGHIERERVFSIEKKSNKNIKNLKMCIASTLKFQDQWGENVPIAWAKLESFLRKMRERKKICFILDLLKDIQKADDQLLKNREELVIALKFFNDVGVILFQMEVENVVILDVQWFVDAFKCIILDEHHKGVKDKYNLTQFDDLNNSGLLYSKLLESLWGEGNFLQHKKSLVYYMKHLDMLAEVSPEWWYVPCMNKQKYTDSIMENCTVSSTLCFVFEFLPFVIFHRLIVACINKLEMALWQSQRKNCIYHNATILCCKNTTHRVLIGIHDIKGRKSEEYHYSIEIQAIVTNSDSRTLDSQICSKIKQNIYQILHDLTRSSTMKEELFQIGYRCTITPYSNHPKDHIILEKDLYSEVDCSQCAPVHAVEVTSIIGFWKIYNEGPNAQTGKGPGKKIPKNKGSGKKILLMRHREKMSLSKYKSTQGTTRLAKISRAILGPKMDVLREVLAKEISPSDLEREVETYIYEERRPLLTENQIRLVYGKNYSAFDITLVYFIFRNICKILPHVNGWGKDPEPTDRSVSANIERCRIIRNEWYAHAVDFSLSDSDFDHKWNQISQIVKELEGYLGTATKYQDALIALKTCCMDPDSIELYIDAMMTVEWLQTNVTNLKEEVEEIKKVNQDITYERIGLGMT